MWRSQKKIYNAYCTQKSLFAMKDFKSWDPKIHGPCTYLQSFYVDTPIEECGTEKHYPLAMFWNGIWKKTRSSYKGMMNDGTRLSSSDSEKASKKKNWRYTFEK